MTRQTPTQKQLAALEALTDDELLARALGAMHALNRRAKEKRDRSNAVRRRGVAEAIRDEIESIYRLKTRFMQALVTSRCARVESWSIERRSSARWYCSSCDRSFGGASDECYRCGDSGEPNGGGETYTETWCLIDCNGYRFHQPPSEVTAAMLAIAVPVDGHDPTQPQREIPNVGLTIEAQRRCVEMMISRLETREVAK